MRGKKRPRTWWRHASASSPNTTQGPRRANLAYSRPRRGRQKGPLISATAGMVICNDMQPKMIMHPTQPALNGRGLSDYKDPEGKALFVVRPGIPVYCLPTRMSGPDENKHRKGFATRAVVRNTASLTLTSPLPEDRRQPSPSRSREPPPS